ncbi:hypothetical protein BN3662_02500 [Clostridiales bacterium CHKCI006]|nr:hypothetical protein BN3662_02500 [Clostridiales bacterium CHKCI006]
MDSNNIVIVDENGKEQSFEILFTFTNEQTGRSYVLYYDPEEDEPGVMASVYDEEGNLFAIESPEEWDMISDVFDSFMSQDEEGCHCGGQCQHDHEGGCCGQHAHGEGCCHEHNKTEICEGEEDECCD